MPLLRTLLASAAGLVLASSASATSLVFENEFSSGAVLNGSTVMTSDNNEINITTSVTGAAVGGGPGLSPFGSNSEFIFASGGTTGGHTGFGFLGFDNTDNDTDDFLEITFTFLNPVLGLTFSLLDVDSRNQPAANNFQDGVVITYNGGTNVVGDPSLYSLGPNVAVGTGGLGEFVGVPQANGDATPNASTDSNLDVDFGTTSVSSFTIRYFSTADAPANPSGQLLGISDLAFVSSLIVPEPGTGALLALGLAGLAISRRSA